MLLRTSESFNLSSSTSPTPLSHSTPSSQKMAAVQPTTMQSSPLANPLATVNHLETSGSLLDGIPADLEDSVRFAGAKLTQAAGILLRLPQEIIAQAIVMFMRFWIGPDGGSLLEFGAEVTSPHPPFATPTNKQPSKFLLLPSTSPPNSPRTQSLHAVS